MLLHFVPLFDWTTVNKVILSPSPPFSGHKYPLISGGKTLYFPFTFIKLLTGLSGFIWRKQIFPLIKSSRVDFTFFLPGKILSFSCRCMCICLCACLCACACAYVYVRMNVIEKYNYQGVDAFKDGKRIHDRHFENF